MQFTVKSLNAERMWPTQWPSLCWGKDGATTARLPGCHHSQLTLRTLSMRSSVSTKTSHSWALPTQGVVALWERTKSCPNLCSWTWGAEIRIKFSGNLERLKYKVCISTYSGSDSHIFQTALERAVLKYSSGTCLYHQFSLSERFNIPQITNNFFFLTLPLTVLLFPSSLSITRPVHLWGQMNVSPPPWAIFIECVNTCTEHQSS